ncbi:MAG: HIT family protein [Methylococcales bacterium]|jgi:diadenosine tetraphosphate (Ap4A) HIT family hydrolase|nr:HIT family protein [Methylococcales bacterium]
MAFEIDPTLDADTIHLGDFPLCECRLLNNQTLPWIILVPKVEGLQELYELSDEMYQQFSTESLHVARVLKYSFHADKMNIAAIGNVVSQLHIHHVARYQTDPLWPNVVWGSLAPNPYDDNALLVFKKQFLPLLQGFMPKK